MEELIFLKKEQENKTQNGFDVEANHCGICWWKILMLPSPASRQMVELGYGTLCIIDVHTSRVLNHERNEFRSWYLTDMTPLQINKSKH